MEVDPTVLKDQVNKNEAVASVPGSENVRQQREDKAKNIAQKAFCEANNERLDSCIGEARSFEQPRPKETAASSSAGDFIQTPSQSAGAGLNANCDDQGGCEASRQIQRDRPPEDGSQHMGPLPGQNPDYGQYYYYANSGIPPFIDPMGGPHQWIPPGAAYHQRASPQGLGMHPHPYQGPYFGPTHGMGQGCTGAPHHSVQSEQNSGQFADMLGKALNGQASTQDLVSGLLNLNFSDDQFWKGVVAGGVAALILNSDSVRQVLSGMLGGVFGGQARAEDKTGETTP